MIEKLAILLILICEGMCMETVRQDKTKLRSLINEYSNELNQKKQVDFRLIGFECAGPDKVYDGKIHEISLGYSIDKRMKLEEGRKLFYEIVDGLIEKINNNKEMEKLFYHYPIGYEDFDLFLSFDYENKGYLKKDDISQIAIGYKKIYYFLVNKETTPSEMKKEQVSSDIFIFKGYGDKYRTIKRPLPETEAPVDIQVK